METFGTRYVSCLFQALSSLVMLPGITCSSISTALTKHAAEVDTEFHYLEIIDLMLFCHNRNIELTMYQNTETAMLRGTHAMEFVGTLFGIPEPNLPIHLNSSGAFDVVSWNVVCTRADFLPTNKPWDLNHWVPAFKTDSLSLSQRLQEIQAAEKAEKEATLEVAQEASCSSTVQSCMDYVERLSERSCHFKRLTTRLHIADKLFPVAARADGNCGLWSLLDLLKHSEGVAATEILSRDPLGTGSSDKHPVDDRMKMLSLRTCIGDMWRALAADPTCESTQIWWSFLRMFDIDSAGVPVTVPAAEVPEGHVEKAGFWVQ